MSTHVGYYSHPTWGHEEDDAGAENEQAALVTFPNACTVVTLGAWLQSQANDNVRLVMWDATTLQPVVQSALFSIGNTGNDARFEHAITPYAVAAGASFYIGWVHSASDPVFLYPINAAGSGSHLDKKQASGWPGSLSGAATLNYQISAYAVLADTENMGTLTVDTSAAPTVTFSWTACSNPGTVAYEVTFCQKNANTYEGNDHNAPTYPQHLAVGVPYGTNSVTVDLTNWLFPGDWVVQVHAGYNGSSPAAFTYDSQPETGLHDVSGVSNWVELGYTSVQTLTIASPTFPYGAGAFWFDASGVLHYTAAYKAWYLASVWQITQPFASRFPGAVLVS
jgi:hypothetical protein